MLDTTICAFLLRGKFNLNEKLIAAGGFAACVLSEITVAELKYGAEKSTRAAENRRAVTDFIRCFEIVPISNCLDLFAHEKARLETAGTRLDDFDLLIGCSAVENNYIMVTDNEKHLARISNITIENWVERKA
jgi:tRNA(fMet)-specific endonuclease VapC